jgi:predicted RNA binding protein YcfA (HicA-like mRNA interferase family)
MGRLAGFRYRDITRRLKALGMEFHRQAAGSHEIWHHPATNRYTTIPNHPGDMPEGTLRAILKQAGIEPDAFLQNEVIVDIARCLGCAPSTQPNSS